MLMQKLKHLNTISALFLLNKQHIEYCNITKVCITAMDKFGSIFAYILLKNQKIDIFYFLKNYWSGFMAEKHDWRVPITYLYFLL